MARLPTPRLTRGPRGLRAWDRVEEAWRPMHRSGIQRGLMSTSKAAWAMPFALVLSASLGCNKKPPTPTTEAPSPADASAVNAPPEETAQPVVPLPAPSNPVREVDAGPPEWYTCQTLKDCIVVPAGRCCPDCDPLPFVGYSAVNAK